MTTQTRQINKVVRLGTDRTGGGRVFSTYAHIKYVGGRLSISGVEGPLPNGSCLGGAGQIDTDLTADSFDEFAPGWDRPTLHRFLSIWDEWHLNDMQPACEHQRALGWTYNDHHDPETFKGEACPVCGYSIGSAWLTKEVPADVLDFLEALPDTDKQPAWV